MSTYTQFTIRCSRDLYNAAEDDVITIKPRWNVFDEDTKMLEYVVKHRIATCSAPDEENASIEQILYGDSIQNYVENLIDLLAADIHPFKQIQFDFPCMPSIIVAPKQLPTIHEAIMSIVYEIQESWPTIVVKKVKKVKKVRSNHLNVHAEPFVPEAYRTPQRPATRSPSPPRIQRPAVWSAARHIFFDEEDGHVTRYFN